MKLIFLVFWNFALSGLQFDSQNDFEKTLESLSNLIPDNHLPAYKIIRGNIDRLKSQDVMAKFCPACYLAAKSVLPIVKSRFGANAFIWTLKRLCITFKLFDDYICRDTIDLFRNEFLGVVREVKPDPRSVCHMLVSECYKDWNIFERFNWTSPILPPKIVDNDYTFPTSDVPTLKVLHVTDIHIDLEYEYGSNVACSQPLCCRAQSDGVSNSPKSYYWGSRFSCDIPFRTFEQSLRAAKEIIPAPDFIMWTGDAPAHDIWAYSQDKSNFFLKNITQTFRRYYPDAIIYPVIGNHEGVPVNAFPSDNYWLYENMADAWQEFDLEEQSYQTIARHGYYTQLYRPGFRIVAINSNFCNDENFWILTSSGDPGHQNSWLVRTLYAAEMRGERVALIGHIPPGGEDQISNCSKEFYRIINRFSNTVTSQFYGHTHWDHIKIFYQDYDQNKASNIAYISPSLTTWVGMDPSFRIYEMDHVSNPHSSFAVLDHHTYSANVQIPKNQNLKFELKYSARSEYNLTDLSPKSWANCINQWETEEENGTFQKYYHNKYHGNLDQICDSKCRNETLCYMNMAENTAEAKSHFCT